MMAIFVVEEAHPASGAFQAQVLADAPLLYYQLNESSGPAINYGSLGSSFDGAYNGTIARGVGTLGGDAGVGFDGSDDFIESATAAPVGLTGNPTFTAETVVFVPLTGGAALWAPFLHWGAPSTSLSVYFSFSNNDADEVYAGFYNGGLQTPGGAQTVLPLGTWHHVVWVRQGGGTDQVGTSVFVDGVDVSSLLVADPALCCNGSTPAVTSTTFRINRATDFARFFIGRMDELALYDRALTAQEVQDHYAALAASQVPVLGLVGLGVLLSSILLVTSWGLDRRRCAD
jgi:hypothetical protein